jgi:hypothetical protein
MQSTVNNLIGTLAVTFALSSCATEDLPTDSPATSIAESALTCTPGRQQCDPGCVQDGGPSGTGSGICRIICNNVGTAWVTLEECELGFHCTGSGFQTVCVPD